MTTVSLVLGSGGARGYAHIGVIEELEHRGYHINCVAGSSMGALIGGLYAADHLAAYKAWAMTLSRLDVISLLDLTFSLGAIRGERLFNKLDEFIGDRLIESLRIPFTAVAADIVHQKEVWFQQGALREAIRASIAVPGIFTPVVQEHRVLVDGGVLNPLPIIPAVAARSDLIIAVDLNSQSGLPAVALPPPKIDDDIALENDFSEHESLPKPAYVREKFTSNLDIIMNSLEVMQGALAQYKIAGYPPDLLIEVPTDVCQFHDFHRATDVIEAGRQAAVKALDEMEAYARDRY